MFVTAARRLLLNLACRLAGTGRAWLFTGLLCSILLVDLMTASAAGAQALGDPRPTNRQICDVNVTVVAGQTFQRDVNADRLAGACTGTYTGTPNRSEGYPGPNGADVTDDQYPTLGTTAAVNPSGMGAQRAGAWQTAENDYRFTYTAGSTAGTDTFVVFVLSSTTRDSARVYYRVTVTPPAPTVTAVNPSSGGLGQTAGIVITGTNFTPSGTSVTFGGVAAVAVAFTSPTELTATAPATATPGSKAVVVTTAGGQSSGSIVYRQYAAATNAAAFAPASVTTGASATLTFTLTNPWTNPGAFSALGFSATIPANLTLTGQATTCTGGSATIGGGAISLSGGSLAAGATCTVTATASSATAGSYAITPAAVSGRGARGNADGTSEAIVTGTAGTAATLTVQSPAPTVTSIAPTGGSTGGGTPVTITGTNFLSGNSYTATFGATTVAATYASTTTLTATAPAGSGTVAVTVANTTSSQAGTGSASYTYAAPTVTGLSVTAGPANQVRAVTITGTNFTPTATVSVGGTPATGVTYIGATQLTATLPAKAAGTYDVLVTTGAVTSAANPPADQYTYIAAPVVTGVTPNSGSTAGGTPVTVTGNNLNGATAVTFGGNAATSVVVAGDGNSLTATTPSASAAGAVAVAVTTPGGTGQLAGGYTYVVLSAPAITGQPGDATVAVGATATFTAGASGSPSPTVQWQVSTGGGSFADIPGETATSYVTPATVAGDNGNRYRAVFTNSQGTATSSAATLTVVQAPTANAQSVAVAYQTATPITLTGTDPNTPARTLTYAIQAGPAHGAVSSGTTAGRTYTPAAGYVGTDSFTFTVSNGVATSAPATVSITVGKAAQTITFTSTAPANAVVGGATYTVAATATSGGAVAFTSQASGVCMVSGSTVSFVGTGTCTIAANQAGNATFDPAPEATQAFTVAAPTITLAPGAAPGGTVGVAYSQTYTASGGTGPYSYSVTGTIPAGMTFVSTVSGGRLSGTPTAGGSFSFTVTAQDASPSGPYSGSQAYTLMIAAPTVTPFPANLPNPQVGVAYNQALSATGGTAPYSYAVTGGALPAGLTLVNGVIQGTPTTGGNATFQITATDSSTGTGAPYSGARNYGVTVAAATVTITPTSLPGATGGTAYSQVLTASGGTAPYTFTTAGPLPAGLALAGNGTLQGTPTQAGSFNFTVRATDSSSGTAYFADQAYTLTVGAPTVVVGPPTLPGGTVAAGYSQTLTASGGNGSYTYSLVAGSGALPAGITLSSSGALSGTPTAGGSFGFTVRATDGNGFSGTRAYTLAIGAPTVTVAPGTLPGATRNVAYSQQLTASGGTAGYTFSLTGALPTGMTLSPSGLLSGTPTAAGSFSFTATASDSSTGSGPYSGAASYTLAVDVPAIVLAPVGLPGGTTRIAYSQGLTASGGTGPYVYSVTAGALPNGIALSAGGTLSGTTTTAGTFNFTATATDVNGNTGTRGYTLTIAAPTIVLAPATLPAATTRVAYSQALSASGGTGPYAYAVTAGALPSGITLSAGGTLSGTSNVAGSFSFTVTATDTNGNSGVQGYTLAVGAPAITLSPASLPGATVGAAFNQALTASGGGGSYAYAITAGALPAGVTLTNAGALAGTPTAGGSFGFTVTATDANGNAGARGYTLAVAAATIALAPTQLPAATTGTAYSQALTASGGTAPYSYAVTAGALPTGVTLAANGTLSGTASTAGSFSFTATATDSSTGNGPFSGSQGYTLTVGQTAQTITFANPGARRLDQSPVALTASASSGLAVGFASGTTQVCTVSGNSATLLRAGTCTITASQAGNANTAPAADVVQSFQVEPSLVVATVAQAAVSATVGVPVNAVAPVTASGGTTPYGYALSGTLPAGLVFSGTTGQLSGTPTAGQAATAFTVTIADAGGQTASAGFTLAVAAPTLVLTPAALPDGAFEVTYSQQLSASGGVAPYRYAVTAGALPAGLTLSAQGLLAGTPTAFGTFNATITATDSAGGSGPFSVANAYTLTIQPPAIPVAGNVAVTVGFGSTDTVITPQLSGGAATTLAIATQPSGGTARVEGRTLVYTPRAGFGGANSFTYTAGNAGGVSAPATVTVTVTAPAVALTTATLPNAQEAAAYSQQLGASGGTAPYGFAVTAGSLPAGLTLSPAGLLSGVPVATGRADFTVAVTDSSTGAGPYRASRAYTLAIDLPPPPVVQPVPAATAAGSTTVASTPVRLALSDYISGDYTGVEVTVSPRDGTLVISQTAGPLAGGTTTLATRRFTATYTPNVGFSGTDSFAFVAVGPGGRSAPATVTIRVLGAAPVATPLTASTVQGTPVTVDLTAGASGGPFTAARVVAVTPAGSLQTQLVEGGTAGNRSYRLTITPTLTYSGNATVSYALSNAFGESVPATVTVAVAARPDPSADPTVNGLSTAQADATRRFANAQLQNFTRRNEQLHNGGGTSGGYTSNMSLTGGDPARQIAQRNEDTFLQAIQGRAREVAGAEYSNGTLVRAGEGGYVAVAGGRGRAAAAATSGRPGALAAAPGQPDATDDGTAGPGGRKVGSVAIWSGGAIAVGTRDRTTQRDRLSVTTGGLSSGIDVKLSEGLIVGVGGGYGADRTKLDDGAAQVKGDAWSVAGYGSWSPTDGLFVDGVFGGGQLDFRTRRAVAQTGSIATGSREGKMLFGSLAFGFDRRLTDLDLSLYGRIDWLTADLDRYSEGGAGIYSLTFGERDLTSVMGVLGGRVALPLGGATGRLRGEYRHEFNATGAQLVDYADIVNLRYRTRGDQWLRDAFALDAELEAPLGRGWTGGLGAGVAVGSGAVSGTGRVELRKQFR